ncbi:MAG TPA: MFS transporter [Sphingobium sp.]
MADAAGSETIRTDMNDAPPAPRGGPYAWLVLFVLILAYMVSFIDRQMLTLLVGPIRATLHITDFQLSLLHGFAFALFYTVMGIPIGRMVDRRRRTFIIAAGIAVWSVMTALCGLARSFTQLFLARIGVGMGEAALSPGAYSLLSDHFPPKELPRALSIYTGAAHVGAGIATIAGGALITLMPRVSLPGVGALEPWQAVFVAVGLPGLLVALLVLLLREPQRTGMKAGPPPGLGEVFDYIRDRRGAFLYTILGYSVAGVMWNGSIAWLPTFFMRAHGWTIAETGLRYGLAVMIGGLSGVLCGGWLAVRMRAKGHLDANIRVGFLSLAIAVPTGVAGVLIPNATASLVLIYLFLFGCAMPWGGAAAALQEITPNQMRGQVSALYLFCLSLCGMGFGPAIVAGFTDHLFGRDDALPWSLALTILLTAPVAAILLWRACAPYRAALARNPF